MINKNHKERIEAILRHYNHAKAKDPYFADILARYKKSTYLEILDNNRVCLQNQIKHGRVEVDMVLACELVEMYYAIQSGEKAQAIQECYDAIAVLLRVVDVLEGRQKLGKPEKAE